MRRRLYDSLSTAKEGLAEYRVHGLKRLAKEVLEGPPARKEDLVRALAARLTGPSLKVVFDRLSDLEKTAVAEVVHGSGRRFDRESFLAKYGECPDLKLEQHPGYGRKEKSPRQSLLPLFFYSSDMPEELKEELVPFVPRPGAAGIETVDAPPAEVELARPSWYLLEQKGRDGKVIEPVVRQETARPALHDIFALLRLVESRDIPVSEKTRRVSAAGAKAILPVLHSGDFYPSEDISSATETMRPFAWPLILQAAKLVRRTGTRLKSCPGGRKAFLRPPHEVVKEAFEAWLPTDILDEYNRIETVQGQTGRGKRCLTLLFERRDEIVAALCECPAGEWIHIDEFFRFIRASGHNFKVADRDPWDLYVGGSKQHGSLGYDGAHTFEILEGRYTMVFLWEYLGTLGLVDVAYISPEGAREDFGHLWDLDELSFSRYDGLLYFRINALGAYCLGLAEGFEAPVLEERHALTVMPNLEIAATGERELLPAELILLGRFADKASDRLWKLRPQTVLSAAEKGLAIQEMVEFLDALSGSELPETVQRFFRDLEERLGKLFDRGASRLIEVADPTLAQMIVNDSRLKKLCLLAGDRHLVVPQESEKAFKRALRELGYACVPGK